MSHVAMFCLALAALTGCSDTTATDQPDPGGGPGPAAVASVTVGGPATPLTVGQTAQLTATARDADGNPVQGAAVEWITSAPQVATVSSSGVATAVGPGTATITATAGGRSGTLPLEVRSPPPPGVRGSIAYVKDDALRIIQPDGSGERLVWTLPDTTYGISGPVWRPDGGEIAFASNHEMAVSFYERDIYAIRPDGSGLRRLTNAPAHAELQGFAKGTVTVTVQNHTFDGGPYFVYVAGAPQPQSVTLGAGASATLTFRDVADLGPDNHQPVVVISGIFRWWNAAAAADVKPGATVHAGAVSISANPVEHFGADGPFWRSDGSRVGYLGTPTCLPQQVPASPPPGASYDPLVDPGTWGPLCAMDWAPLPTLANQLLVVDMDEYTLSGETRIYRVTEGSSSRGEPVVTFGEYVRVVDIRWLPDGSGFVVARQDGLLDEDINLYEFSFASGALRKLTDFTGGFVRFFSIAPDGAHIVFERITGGSPSDLATLPSDLWVMRRDGSGARLLVSGGRSPAW